MVKWFQILVKRVVRYGEYLWDGIKGRWKSFSKIGLFGFIKGFFTNFFESFALLKIDIQDGYI